MKRLLCVLAVLSIACFAFSHRWTNFLMHHPMQTDLQQYGLQGRVKSYTMTGEAPFAVNSGETAYFDRWGNLERLVERYWEEESTTTYAIEYDEKGKILSILEEGKEGKIWHNYEYGDKDFLSRLTYVKQDGEITMERLFTFDNAKNRIVENNITYEETVNYDLDGRIIGYKGSEEFEFSYDKNGYLIERIDIIEGKRLKVKFVNDDWGNELKTLNEDDSLLAEHYEYEYDDAGNITKLVYYQMDPYDRSEYTEAHFVYEYYDE